MIRVDDHAGNAILVFVGSVSIATRQRTTREFVQDLSEGNVFNQSRQGSVLECVRANVAIR